MESKWHKNGVFPLGFRLGDAQTHTQSHSLIYVYRIVPHIETHIESMHALSYHLLTCTVHWMRPYDIGFEQYFLTQHADLQQQQNLIHVNEVDVFSVSAVAFVHHRV